MKQRATTNWMAVVGMLICAAFWLATYVDLHSELAGLKGALEIVAVLFVCPCSFCAAGWELSQDFAPWIMWITTIIALMAMFTTAIILIAMCGSFCAFFGTIAAIALLLRYYCGDN